ncbi:MAG: AarF/ABC1/UbiB kinase family protein, partial [Actinomycetia bacterium]|nr:AarF/ABC1/UbiB kinase family protein [Actinomycetes bacterium]
FFHADPHPGNLFVAPGPLITFIDFGMVGEITPAMRAAFREVVIGVAQKDSNRLIEAFRELGFIRPGADVTSVKRAFDWLLENYSDLASRALDFSDIEEIHEDILKIFREQPITIPAQFAFLGKTLGMMVGLATGLDPSMDLVEATKPYVAKLVGKATEDKWELVMSEAKKIGKLLFTMPTQISDTLDLARRGQLKVKVDAEDIARALARSHGGRAAWGSAIFGASGVVSGAWLISLDLSYEGLAFMVMGIAAYLYSVRK